MPATSLSMTWKHSLLENTSLMGLVSTFSDHLVLQTFLGVSHYSKKTIVLIVEQMGGWIL